MTIRVRQIKPGPFRSDRIFKRLRDAADRTAKLADKEFKKTYATWDHKPKFTKGVKVTGAGISWFCQTDDQIYIWVSGGTKGPYPIPKAGPGLLVFPSGYKAKTTPKTLFSGTGGPFGPPVFVKGQVQHPGIKAREFDKTVLLYVKPWYQKWMEDAMKVGARESGHST